jgi:hypothetical protein
MSYPQEEDWGWFLAYGNDAGSEFAVECCNVDKSKEGWRLTLRRYGRKPFGFDKPPWSHATVLVGHIKRILLDDEAFSDMNWRFD